MSPQFRLSLRRAVGILALALISTPPAACAPLTDVQRQADPRLQKKVTIVASHILIGELLEKLSAQSGVSLTVGEKDGTGDAEVLVSLKDVKLADAMDALYSLVSYKQAEWSWEQTGEGKNAVYRLAQPPAAQALAAALKAQVQKEFEAEAKTMLAAVKMTPEERKRRIAELSGKDDASAFLLKDNRLCDGLSIFATAVSAELQASVLQGKQRPRVPLSQLSDAGRAFVHAEWVHSAATHNRADGTAELVPEPTFVFFNVSRPPNAISPILWIGMEGQGAYGYVGGTPLDKELRKKLAAYWLLPGDMKEDDAEAHQVAAPKVAPPILDSHHAFHNGFLQLSDAANVPVIARLFNEEGYGTSVNKSPYGKTVEEFLTPLRDDMGMPHKWHDGILLLTYNGWFMEEDDQTRVPWAIVKRLRDSESAAPDGFLPVSELFYAARHLTRPQMTRLADWFPVMANLANWYDLFSLAANSSELQTALLSKTGSTRGDALTAASAMLGMSQRGAEPTPERMTVADLRAAQQKAAEQRIADRTFKRVRLTLGDYLTLTPPMREVMVEALSPTGQRVGAQGFRYPKHQFVSAGRK